MSEPVLRPVLAFLMLVLVCGALIAATAALTGERIEANHARRALDGLTELTGNAALAAQVRWQDDVALLCPDKALLRGSAPGYGGDIRWLASVQLAAPPTLLGLRITDHQETPGIADFLNRPGQGWLESLIGRNPEQLAAVDAVTGATITSRALRHSLTAALGAPALQSGACQP